MCTSKEYGQSGHEKCGDVAFEALTHLDLERDIALNYTEIKHTPENPKLVLLVISALNESIVYRVELDESPTTRVVALRELKQQVKDLRRN